MFGESRSHSEVFGDRGGHEDLRLGQMGRHDAVDDLEGQPRIVQRGGAEFRPLFDGERRR